MKFRKHHSQKFSGVLDAVILSELPPSKRNQSTDLDNASVFTFANNSDLSTPSAFLSRLPNQTKLLFCFIIILGCAAAGAFVSISISGANREKQREFDLRSHEIVSSIQSSWRSYKETTLYIHEACRKGITREQFRKVYNHVNSTGLTFQIIAYLPKVRHEQRDEMERESSEYLQKNYPNANYRGFTEPDGSLTDIPFPLRTSENRSFYYPARYLEPIVVPNTSDLLDFDFYSVGDFQRAIRDSLDTRSLFLSRPLNVQNQNERAVLVIHPGVSLSGDDPETGVAAAIILITELINFALKDQRDSITVYLYDTEYRYSVELLDNEGPLFLGGVTMTANKEALCTHIVVEEEIPYDTLQSQTETKMLATDITIAGVQWTVVVVAPEGTYEADHLVVILGGTLIFASCLFLALWLYSTLRRQAKINKMEVKAKAEKVAIRLENARQAARAERELNDFIAHEVRNPLSAAMSACSFVSTAINDETQPLTDPENKMSVQEDVNIIQSSLQFINELLRNMLDMHRASSNELQIELALTDVLHDILLPVESMLYNRGRSFAVEVDCPEGLIVLTDRLRLKQIMLNLGRNATKFVDKGFVRLRGGVVGGSVCLYVEDSGCGIPVEKREQLFAKFQESLDTLNQGTGIGLSLCKQLAELLRADIAFDEAYHSGIEGCPGTRFAINLNMPAQMMVESRFNDFDSDEDIETQRQPENGYHNDMASSSGYFDERKFDESVQSEAPIELPESLSVLFVDDDLVLRKLFSRAVRKATIDWSVKEAANGETALRIVEEERFDLIFMDQYMTSVEKQLLGTETVRAMRARGVLSIICGLSANDTEREFLEAGANAFMVKPFPCDKVGLKNELHRVLSSQHASVGDG